MFRINRSRLEAEAKQPSAKSTPLQANATVFDGVKLVFINLIDEITKLKLYNAAHWACNMDRWIDNLSADNKTTYQRGEIVFLDLGAQNFKYEPSYTHACIVLENRAASILIVPCSTKKYGSGYRDIIDATPADGFQKNTGIQSESFRWVNKNRVVSRTGNTVSSRVLDELDKVLLSLTPYAKKEIRRLDQEVTTLKNEVATLKSQLAALGSGTPDTAEQVAGDTK